MKVTFIYSDYAKFNVNNFNRGVALLSACLKEKGYQASLIHITKRIKENEFLSLVKIHNPDIIAFSYISFMFPQIKKFSLWLKELHIPMIHGGMHPTVAPEECLQENGINVICRGEGEGAIIDFCQAVEKEENITHIPNLWVKEDGKIYKNHCRPLVENLDILPYPDYNLFHYEDLEESRIHKILVTQASRGCPYNCTYCCNPMLRSLYPNKEKFLRHYSVDRLLNEIEWALSKFPFLKEVRFYDDTLTQDKAWFKDFALKYKKRIGLPYSGNERVENVDSETATNLKQSGCIGLDVGIESASIVIREKYMNRWMSNDKIIAAFSILKSSGIKVNSFNIIGMVGETKAALLETIKLNALVSPNIVFNAYFYPFEGTGAYNVVEEKKYRVKAGVSGFFEAPVVVLESITESELIFFYRYFFSLMKLYRFLWAIFGQQALAVQCLDKIITFRYFPYCIFNFFHFGKEDIIAVVRRKPGLYLFFRNIYRFCKKQKWA